MASVETYLRRRRLQLRRWMQVPEVRRALCTGGCLVGGFLISGATLGWGALPLNMALCAALSGWKSIFAGLGGLLGCRLFWGAGEVQGLVWVLQGTALGLMRCVYRQKQEMHWPVSIFAAALAAVTGLIFQFLGFGEIAFAVYLLRVGAAFGGTLLFCLVGQRREPALHWLFQGVMTLALTGVQPVKWLNFGDMACGYLFCRGSFPAAMLAAAAVDISRSHPFAMSAIICLAFYMRRLPVKGKWLPYTSVGILYLGMMVLWGSRDLSPLPGLMLGIALGQWLSLDASRNRPVGRTGYAQVRLELTADVMTQIRLLLEENPLPPVDQEALLERARYRACSGCPSRNRCTEQYGLNLAHLHQTEEFLCRKPARILGQLRRSREQLCALRREHHRQEEYRWALIQQYQCLSEQLRSLADRLTCREPPVSTRFRIRVAVRSRKKELVSGDRCAVFPAGEGCVYVALCDGMGTGLGAAREGLTSICLLKQMLQGGYTPQQAFRSINSILALRGRGGAVTLDLAQVHLDTGKARLYKWGAAPSCLVTRRGIETLGSATPPPGLWIREGQESKILLSLARGQSLVLLSDGAQDALQGQNICADMTAAELAQTILNQGRMKIADDATVAVVQLLPKRENTQNEQSGKL